MKEVEKLSEEMGIISIQHEMKKIGLDPEFIMSLEYKKTQIFLMALINRTEASLISIQEKDGMEVISPRQKSINFTLNGLILAHNKCVQMESIIYALKKENEMLNERLIARK